jgi:hypothetical protein
VRRKKSERLWIKWKTKNTTLSEQFTNKVLKSDKESKSIPLTYKYMTTHFPGLVQAPW